MIERRKYARPVRLRDWTKAREKCAAEGRCRVCHRLGWEAAHVIGRTHDGVVVHPDDVVPLCTRCHAAYDLRRLDLLPYLSLAEQARAALHVGLVRALHRTTSGND